jgi:hypothetical protein
MAKVTIAGDAAVVTSSMKLEDLKTIAKYRPKALSLRGGEDGKELIYSIAVSKYGGSGEINKNGAVFASASHDEHKLATITMHIGDIGDGDIKEIVADQIGTAITNLNKLEETLPDVLEEIAVEKTAVMNNISVAQ